jgi:hypothetical protein
MMRHRLWLPQPREPAARGAHGRSARSGGDSPLRSPLLGLARARSRPRGADPARGPIVLRRVAGGHDPGRERRTECLLCRRSQNRCTDRAWPTSMARPPRRRNRLRAGAGASVRLRAPGAGLARARGSRRPSGSARGAWPAGRVPASSGTREGRLHPCARIAGCPRDRRVHQRRRAVLPPARGRRTDARDCRLSREHSRLAAALPRRGTPLFRPECAVRVGLPTTKEARCPSTSCCRP